MFGIKLEMKDGSVNWIDPVDEDGLIETEDSYSVTNSIWSWTYKKSEVVNMSRYQLCKTCMYDVDTFGCHNGCDNQ